MFWIMTPDAFKIDSGGAFAILGTMEKFPTMENASEHEPEMEAARGAGKNFGDPRKRARRP